MLTRLTYTPALFLGVSVLASPAPAPAEALPPDVANAIELERVFPQLGFQQGLYMTQAPGDPDRFFVVSQLGRIYTVPNTPDPAPGDVEVFLDVSAQIRTGGERGLLGLAFDPDYMDNGQFYINYTAETPGLTSILSRLTNDDPASNSPALASEEILLEIPQPATNHNAGWIAFGPDGMLYYAMGDGGGTAWDNAQDTTNLLGTIMRIDVRAEPAPGENYVIPADNPFVGGGPDGTDTREEIYAYGLRNPWRNSFDFETGVLYTADVGQSTVEEVNVIVPGGNYGWPIVEGTVCFQPPQDCDPSGTIFPIAEYFFPSPQDRRSVTGGYVYRSERLPQLQDVYFFGDYMSGELLALRYDPDTEEATEIQTIIGPDESSLRISSFGQDLDGEIYVVDYNVGSANGGIYRITADLDTSTDAWLYY